MFETPVEFPERGGGEVIADLATAPVAPSDRVNELSATFDLTNGSIGTDVVELQAGTYGRARRQMFGSLMFGVTGQGATVSFQDPTEERSRVEWEQGIVFGPVGLSFHQHFNMGSGAARFLRVDLGTSTFPILRPRKRAYGDTSVYASGNAEIPYADEPAEIRSEWLAAIGKLGVTSRM